jgi:hypothetical protein
MRPWSEARCNHGLRLARGFLPKILIGNKHKSKPLIAISLNLYWRKYELQLDPTINGSRAGSKSLIYLPLRIQKRATPQRTPPYSRSAKMLGIESRSRTSEGTGTSPATTYPRRDNPSQISILNGKQRQPGTDARMLQSFSNRRLLAILGLAQTETAQVENVTG